MFTSIWDRQVHVEERYTEESLIVEGYGLCPICLGDIDADRKFCDTCDSNTFPMTIGAYLQAKKEAAAR